MNNKKNEGEFYTPDIFADYSHKVLEKHFGKNWYNEYYVWDPSWGIGNLTRSKKFKHLYVSTLHQYDIDESDANPEAEKFKFDFLNDPIKSLFGLHIPESLYNALLKNKPIIFLMNPPYAAPHDMKVGHKDVEIDTYVHSRMGNMRFSKTNLFSQFIYRVMMIKNSYNLTNCNICVFSSSVFMSGSGYKKFRKAFLDEFNFIDGYLFNASYFDECSKRWGISMSVWKSGKSDNINYFKHNILEVENGKIKTAGTKMIYNIDGCCSFRDYCKEPIKGMKTYPTVTLKNPITVGDRDGSMMTTDAIGFYVNTANNVYESMQNCYILSSAPNNIVSGFSVTKNNFVRICTNFTSRKVIANNWINNKDEFLKPDVNHDDPKWKEFEADSLVYSMFNSASRQTSIKNAKWKGYTYDINNAFFFMNKKEMMSLADDNDYLDMVKSTFDDNDRYAFELLEGDLGDYMSKESIDVLCYARKLVRDTFKYRREFNEKYPEYFVMNWDAGYYQLRPMWKMYSPDALKEFRKIYKALGKKLKPQVHEFGILK